MRITHNKNYILLTSDLLNTEHKGYNSRFGPKYYSTDQYNSKIVYDVDCRRIKVMNA